MTVTAAEASPMTRKEAMDLCKERVGTRLNRSEKSVLERLIKATYRQGQPPATTTIGDKPAKALQDTLADGAGYSVRTVQRALDSLVELGLVEVETSRGRNIYRLHLEAIRGWETVKSKREKARKERREENKVRMRVYRAEKAADFDDYTDLVGYAEIAEPRPQALTAAMKVSNRDNLDALEEAWRVSPNGTPEEKARRKELKQAFMEARKLQQTAPSLVAQSGWLHTMRTSGKS